MDRSGIVKDSSLEHRRSTQVYLPCMHLETVLLALLLLILLLLLVESYCIIITTIAITIIVIITIASGVKAECEMTRSAGKSACQGKPHSMNSNRTPNMSSE